jgi:hypothetical protein
MLGLERDTLPITFIAAITLVQIRVSIREAKKAEHLLA